MEYISINGIIKLFINIEQLALLRNWNLSLKMSPLSGSVVAEAPSVDALIAKGKRDLLCSEISSAVECFAKACEIL